MSIYYSQRARKDGTIIYKAQIRVQKENKKYSESKTNKDKRSLEIWAEKRLEQLRSDEDLEQKKHAGTTVGQVLRWYLDDFNGISKFGRSKLSSINFLINHYEFSSLDAVNLKPQQLIKHGMQRAKDGASGATINNDFVWLRNAMRAVKLARDMPLNLQAVDDAATLLRQEKIIGKAKQRNRRPTLDD